MGGCYTTLGPNKYEFIWSNNPEYQDRWLDNIVDEALKPYWLVDATTIDQKQEFMNKIFWEGDNNPNSNTPTYPQNHDLTPITVNGVEYGERNNIPKGYGYYDTEAESFIIGTNRHYADCPCKPSYKMLEDTYDIKVDGNSETGMKLYEIVFNFNMTLKQNKSFYIIPTSKIDWRKIIDLEEFLNPKKLKEEKERLSKKAFYHEQGHNKIVKYCFKDCFKSQKPSLTISMKIPFWSDDDLKQWLPTQADMIRKKIETRYDEIGGDGNSYYHEIYKLDGNPWFYKEQPK